MIKSLLLTASCLMGLVSTLSLNSTFALEPADRAGIFAVIQGYADSWNFREGKGFADGFTKDADFVNIYGMKLSGRREIEDRHVEILQTFFKGSRMEILSAHLREVQPGVVIASVRWRLEGYRSPGSDNTLAGEGREGIFTQVFVNLNKKWEITASQNTMNHRK